MMVEGEEEDKEMTNPSDATIEPIFDRILEKYPDPVLPTLDYTLIIDLTNHRKITHFWRT